MDLFSRKVLSIRISPNNSTRLSKSTLRAAIQSRDIKPGLILHSDRGSNFISYAYNKFLKDHHIIHSYSRPSTPTDNATLESFNRTLKDAIILNEQISHIAPSEKIFPGLWITITIKDLIARLTTYLQMSMKANILKLCTHVECKIF